MSRRRPSATDRAVAAVVATVLAALLAGCGDEATEVAADTVTEASVVAGSGVRDGLALGPGDLELLAATANVEPAVVERTAATLSETEVWARSMAGVRTIYADAPEGVERTLVDVACRSGAGTSVHTDYQLHYAIFPRVNGYNTAEIDRLTETAFDLFEVIHEASRSDRDEERAAAALTCRTLEEALA